VEDVDPNTLHYASDDYPELQDVVWVHPSPEKALEGDPYLHLRSRYLPKKTASMGHEAKPYRGNHFFIFHNGEWSS